MPDDVDATAAGAVVALFQPIRMYQQFSFSFKTIASWKWHQLSLLPHSNRTQ